MNKFHRYISFFLCLAVILFCISSPLHHTALADAATVSISLGGSFVSVSGAVAVAVLVLSGLGIVWGSIEEAVAEAKLWYNAVPKIVKDWLDKAGQEVVEGHTTVKIPETVIEGINSVDKAHQLSPGSPYLDTSGFNLDTISPTDLFAQDVVGAIQQSGSTTHSLLRTLYGLFNTEFTEIDEFISDQTSAISSGFTNLSSKLSSLQSHVLSLWSLLNTSFDDVELSIDTMSSSLSKDLKDLKTLYSSFGNETLSKLDTLNESIQALDSSSLSADFLDLYNLIAQNDALTINALQNLPGQISDSISSYFDTQSLQLEAISDKLGAESSYLLDLVGDMQTLRDEVVDGFADTVVALDQLDVAADINLQPLIDQVLDTEATLVGEFDSLYSLINNNIVAYTASNNELLSSLKGFVDSSNDSLLSLVDQVSYTLDDSLSTVIGMDIFISEQISSLSGSIGSISGHLSGIKTSVQSLFDVTVVKPNTSIFDDYLVLEDSLNLPINDGFSLGGSYFNDVQAFLGDDLNGFLVAGMIFEEFAGMTFFYKLIITSCSVGLIGTLLGMALNVQSYSVSQRRREEAAQVKASNRMQRSCAA